MHKSKKNNELTASRQTKKSAIVPNCPERCSDSNIAVHPPTRHKNSKYELRSIVIYNDEPRIGTWFIAKGFNKPHKDVIAIIEEYKESFEKLLRLKRNKISTKGRPIQEYLLDEDQLTLLVSSFKNSQIIMDFRTKVILEFKKCRKFLQEAKAQHSDIDWQIARKQVKTIRIDTTDAIKEFVVYATAQGSKNPEYYYTNLTKMLNDILFVIEGKFKTLRDLLTPKQLMIIGAGEGVIEQSLKKYMAQNIHYKEIFQLVKKDVIQFSTLVGKTQVLSSTTLLQEVI